MRRSADLVHRVRELAQVADLEDAVAVGRVQAHDRVGAVPLGARLGVEPVQAPRPRTEAAQGVGAGVAIVGAGVAHDDQGAAAVDVAAVALGEAFQHLAVMAVPVAGDDPGAGEDRAQVESLVALGLEARRARNAGSTGTPPYCSARRMVRRTSRRPRRRRRRFWATRAASLRASGRTAWRSSLSWVVLAPRKSTSSSCRSRYSSAAWSAPACAAWRWRTCSASMRRKSSSRCWSRSRSSWRRMRYMK